MDMPLPTAERAATRVDRIPTSTDSILGLVDSIHLERIAVKATTT
jgi:hypothetical protein